MGFAALASASVLAASEHPAGSLQPGNAADPDALYANRGVVSDAQRAADLWSQRLSARPGDFDAAWKLARAGYWLGGHLGTEEARIGAFEKAMDAASKAIAAQPARPEGYFWLAANMGGLAELKGLRAGLKYRSAIRQNLEKVLAIDPAFQKGSADRALGRWYYKVPGLFGGSKSKSEAHLRKALTYDTQSIVTRFFLAETYESMNRDADAIVLLREIEKLPSDPDWAPEDAEFKQKARQMLARLQ
jgi:tetratricopeptide (TPR) repeat protein